MRHVRAHRRDRRDRTVEEDELQVRPEEAVPDALKTEALFRTVGYRCRHCSFETKKRGFSGKQALRAHSKVHVLRRRAWQRPLVRWELCTLALMTLGLAGHLGFRLSSPLFVLPGHPVLLGWGASVLGLVLALGLGAATVQADLTAWPRHMKQAKGLLRACVVYGLGMVLAAGGGCAPGPALIVLLAGAVPLALVPLAAAMQGWTAHDAARGRWSSPGYRRLLKARDEKAEERYLDWYWAMKKKVDEKRKRKG